MAVFFLATVGAAALIENGEDSDAGFIISSDEDYVKTSGSITFTVKNTSQDTVYCKWNLNNSVGKSQSNGNIEIAGGNNQEVSVTAPSTAGNYVFDVKFYNKTEKADTDLIAERQKSLKVVEPVTIKVTFENNSETKFTFSAYLMIKNSSGGWDKVDGSTQDVTVSAATKSGDTTTKGTGTYSFAYVVKDLSRTTTYKIGSDDPTLSEEVKKQLNTEFQFYTSQNSYDFITAFMVIVLIILLIIIIWIYRKPVKNFGKPKGRK